MKHKYFSMEKAENEATINIYGDITSWPWEELGEVSAVNLSKQLEALGDVDHIKVFINSYGGEVAEGLAIYNALRRHNAKVTTYCDGFACSIASVIFMAGDERVMNEASLLMIHNAWTWAAGNAQELRKQADDLEKITQASVEAYKAHSALSEEEIKALMDNESWILPEEALEYGFATTVDKTETKTTNQSAMFQLFDIVKKYQEEKEEGEPKSNPVETTNEPDNTGCEPDGGTGENGTGAEPKEAGQLEEGTKNPVEETENTAQKWSGFFNAILKI